MFVRPKADAQVILIQDLNQHADGFIAGLQLGKPVFELQSKVLLPRDLIRLYVKHIEEAVPRIAMFEKPD